MEHVINELGLNQFLTIDNGQMDIVDHSHAMICHKLNVIITCFKDNVQTNNEAGYLYNSSNST